MASLLKRLFLIIFINFIDQNIALLFSKILIIIPLTFLAYSFYVYKSDSNIGSSEAFFIGLFVDLISDSFLGLNAIFFCLVKIYSSCTFSPKRLNLAYSCEC